MNYPIWGFKRKTPVNPDRGFSKNLIITASYTQHFVYNWG